MGKCVASRGQRNLGYKIITVDIIQLPLIYLYVYVFVLGFKGENCLTA